MQTTEQLFDSENEVANFHDAVVEALGLSFEQGEAITADQLRIAFEQLPEKTRNIAHSWGLSDTPFRDEAYVFIKQRLAQFEPIFDIE